MFLSDLVEFFSVGGFFPFELIVENLTSNPWVSYEHQQTICDFCHRMVDTPARHFTNNDVDGFEAKMRCYWVKSSLSETQFLGRIMNFVICYRIIVIDKLFF